MKNVKRSGLRAGKVYWDILLFILLIFALTGNGLASSVVLYEWDFLNTTAGNRYMGAVGWKSFKTSSATDVTYDTSTASIFVSSAVGNPSSSGNGYLAFASTGSPGLSYVDGVSLENVDAITWNASCSAAYNNTTAYYALVVQVGGAWYGAIPVDAAPVGLISALAEEDISVTIPLSGDGVSWYNFNFIAGTSMSLDTSSAVALPSGVITGVGFYNKTGGITLRIDTVQVTAIPEPKTLAFLVMGGLLLLGLRRKLTFAL